MTRSILGSMCLAAGLFAVPSWVLAVWPPSTSIEWVAEEPSANPQAGKLPSPALQRDVQAAQIKLERDERRLKQIIRDIQEDKAALKKLSQERPAVVKPT